MFPEVTGHHMETCLSEVNEQLGVDEVDLAHVWLRGIDGHSRSVLHGCPEMRITLDPKTLVQRDGTQGVCLLKVCSGLAWTATTSQLKHLIMPVRRHLQE